VSARPEGRAFRVEKSGERALDVRVLEPHAPYTNV
jgi:hypothetical protein